MTDTGGARDEGPLGFGRVVLPLDGSAFALAALPTARALAAHFGARLVAISVATDETEARSLRQNALDSIDGDERDAVAIVLASEPAVAIVEFAQQQRDSIICMSTRGRGRVSGALIGSVARSVVETCGAPMVVLGPLADRPDALVGRPRRRPRSWPEPLTVGEVVACVDGSETSEAALPIAARWAASFEMGFRILTVAEDSPPDSTGARPNRFGPGDPRSYVDRLAGELREAGLTTVGEVVYDPIGVTSGIQAYLARHQVALLVLATQTRSGFERLRLGATAADIVRTSTEPVLVVPVSDRA